MVRFASSNRLAFLLVVAAVATPAATAQAAKPESLTVKSGDTLWGLARQYLGDPFLWPEIYRLNTLVVEDPHWIYPGEVLRLASSDSVSAVPSVDTPLPAAADTPTTIVRRPVASAPAAMADSADMTALFSQSRRNDMMRETLRAYSDQPYRPLRRSEFYSSGFLTEHRALPYGRLLARVTPPQIGVVSSQVSATLFTNVSIAPPSGASYQVGDSLLIVTLGPDIENFGRLVLPTGMLRVTELTNGQYAATVIAVYGFIRNDQRLLPVEHFNDAGSARAVAVADGIQARLLGDAGDRALKKPQDVLFLNKGSKDGVMAGDVFELRRLVTRAGMKTVPEVMATLQVVHVNERTSTTRILSITSPDLPFGSEARQIAKLPS